VYSVLNAPTYRSRFGDGLRYEFARVPFAKDPAIFTELVTLGGQLTSLHLLEHPNIEKMAPALDGDDRSTLTVPYFDAEAHELHLSSALKARPISPAAWEYRHGAYRVLREYLAGREGRVLTGEEFGDFRRVAGAVAMTLQLLPRLDELVNRACAGAFDRGELGLP
jgi:hypothetical protein